MDGIVRLWRGDCPLSAAFWTWAVIGGLSVNIVTTLIFLILMMNDRMVAAFIVGYGLAIPYNLFATVGVWRSAARYEGERRWADLARIVTVTGMILLSLS
jgi:hypothetical protein